MKPELIDHIGIAVRDLGAAITTYGKGLGLPLLGREQISERGLEVAMFEAGPTHIELLAPTREGSEVSKFLDKRGEGMHHLCLRVSELDTTLTQLKASGMRLIDEKPRPGAGGTKVAFVHPSSCNGVLIELVEKDGHKEHQHG
jgi:methylmalonyl-CoA/ethylmalonyl-CoA epimerase